VSGDTSKGVVVDHIPPAVRRRDLFAAGAARQWAPLHPGAAAYISNVASAAATALTFRLTGSTGVLLALVLQFDRLLG